MAENVNGRTNHLYHQLNVSSKLKRCTYSGVLAN